MTQRSANVGRRDDVQLTVRIPGPLQQHVNGGPTSVTASGDTVRTVIQDLSVRYPTLVDAFVQDAAPTSIDDPVELVGVNLYLDDEAVQHLDDGLNTVLDGDVHSELAILPAVAGGGRALHRTD